MTTLSIRVYESLRELESLRPAWEDLLSDFPGATTFSTWEWLAPWWRAYGDGRQLLTLAFLNESEELVGLAPLQIGRRRVAPLLHLRVLGLWGDGSNDSDNLDIPIRPGYEKEVTTALLEFLRKESGRWDICEFNTMPPDSPVGACLEKSLEGRGWTTYKSKRASSAISLPETWEAYLQQLSGDKRRNLKRYLTKLESTHEVKFVKCGRPDELELRLDALFDLHQKRWRRRDQPGTFQCLQRCHFYRDVAPLLLSRGSLEFWSLEVDGQPVAAEFGFRYRGTVHVLQSGFDPAFSEYSVGLLLRGHMIRELIGAGVRRYDFLAGEDTYKSSFGAAKGHYLDVQFARSFSLDSAYLRSAHGAAATKEWLRGHLPRDAWQALHTLNLNLRRVGPAPNLTHREHVSAANVSSAIGALVSRSDSSVEAK